MDLSLIIPTYNEKDNIQELLKLIYDLFKRDSINGEVIIVDDGSPDKTGEIVENLKTKYKTLKIIHRRSKLGLSSAVLEGFHASKSNILCVMDADLSHPPEKILDMFRIINRSEADFVIGSRYVPGGRIEGWNFKRLAMSKGATLLSRMFTPVKDPMSGFFMIKKECIKNKVLNPKGFKIVLELIVKADYKKIKEIPIVFINRKKGKSKAGYKEILYYLSNLIGYLPFKKNVIKEFFKFALVGLLGTFINLFVLYVLTEFLGFYYIVSAIIAFIVAATNNFILNKTFTFRERFRYKIFKKYIQFFSVSLMALGVNILFLYLFTEFLGIYYIISQVIAIGLSLSINFLGNKVWTFRK